jgi:hypothetical protein
MVDYNQFLPMVKASGFHGPVQLHVEYPLGGVENGSRNPTIPKEQVYAAMRRDLGLVRTWLREYGM